MAMSLHQHPGRYALLLGSGISRSAGISTGWGVTLDLIRKCAVAIGESDNCSDNPEKWYRGKFGKNPNYSDILQAFAKTEDERQSLLRSYFEPGSEIEREEGIKVPTPAHHAIARLIKSGRIRVVLTLNFDRLLEDALVAEGVHPNVISSEADASGMVPLNHGEVTVVKLHGDYRDTRLRNTQDELSEYPEQLESLASEILERYGIIVCGWSSDWDTALRDIIRRTTRHRYQSYWMATSDPSENAQALIRHRDATVVPIRDADSAFATLWERTEALDDGLRPDPLTPALAMQIAKRCIGHQSGWVRLHDLILGGAEKVHSVVNRDTMPVYEHNMSTDFLCHRMNKIETICSTLIPSIGVAAYFGDSRSDKIIIDSVDSLLRYEEKSGPVMTWLECVLRYPASMTVYTAGILAVMAGRLDFCAALISRKLETGLSSRSQCISCLIASSRVLNNDACNDVIASDYGLSNQKTAHSTLLCERLWSLLNSIVFNKDAFVEKFDEFEFLLAISYADCEDYGILGGNYSWRYWRDSNSSRGGINRFTIKMQKIVEEDDVDHPLLQGGLCGGSVERLAVALEKVASCIKNW
jgi:hypothetical protein